MDFNLNFIKNKNKYNIYDKNSNVVAYCEQEEIAKRITLCVNACVDFSNDQLKAGNVMDIIGCLIIQLKQFQEQTNTWKQRYEFSANERKKLLKVSSDAKRYNFFKSGNAVMAHDIFTNVDESEWDRYIDDAINNQK